MIVPNTVALVGPFPPPFHGTSVPFQALVTLSTKRPALRIFVVNTQSGDKDGLPVYHPKILLTAVSLIFRCMLAFLRSRQIFVYGSPRFMLYFGSFVSLVGFLTSRRVYLRIAGGGFDNYLSSLPLLHQLIATLLLQQAYKVYFETKFLSNKLTQFIPNCSFMPNWTQVSDIPALSCSISDSSRLIVGFASEIRPEKGVAVLLSAWTSLIDNPDFLALSPMLQIVGSTKDSYIHEFSSLISHAPPNVEVLGYLQPEQLYSWMKTIDILVFPSQFPNEGYPGVLLAALSLGIPVIATYWRALPEIILPNRTGLLFQPGSVEDLSQKLLHLAANPKLRSDISYNAMMLSKDFNASRVLESLLAEFSDYSR